MREPPRRTARIAIVDDDPLTLDLVRRALHEESYEIETFVSPVDAAEKAGQFDLLLSDVEMPQCDGERLAEIFCEARPDTAVVLMSANGSYAESRHTVDFLQKPFRIASLKRAVRMALEPRRATPHR